jgi:hypothetical protein
MELSFKPNLDDAIEHWRAFWNQDIIGRPCCAVTAPRDGVERPPGAPGQVLPDTDFEALLDQAEARLAATYFAGEAMPLFEPSFGPDQAAAFLGARLDWSPDSSSTTWSKPFVEDWAEVLPLTLGGHVWERFVELHRKAGQRGDGKFCVGMLDFHSNFDWLAAIRDPVPLCTDLLDCPDLVHRAMANVRELHPVVYNTLYEAAGMADKGTGGWLPYWCEGRYVTTQCDFCCLLSPAQFAEFVLPALEEECSSVDHSVYHYDGPVALQHFDAITGISALDGIQWQPGAGDKPMTEWVELLQRFQARGKNVFVRCSAEELKEVFHPALKPNLVFYSVGVESEREADELLRWLTRNT